MKIRFPKEFLFGTATSAGQVESAGQHDFKGLKSGDGSVLDRCIEHEKHFTGDSRLIKTAGDGYRFSLDWSKLQKKEFGELDKKILGNYKSFVGKLKGMHLMLTLHHYINPAWFSDIGWESKDSVGIFLDFAGKIVDSIGSEIDSWITINEPEVYSAFSMYSGIFPPYGKSVLRAKKVLKNLLHAHNGAFDIIKDRYKDSGISISKNANILYGEGIAGKIQARSGKIFNKWVAKKFFKKSDFIGIGYYGKVILDKIKRADEIAEQYPQGIKEVLKEYSNFKKEIVITEHGVCTEDDDERIKSIKEHLFYASEAVREGAELKGYFHWSTFDNHEWALGKKKFGLYSVNRNMVRRAKRSAIFFSQLKKNKFFDWKG